MYSLCTSCVVDENTLVIDLILTNNVLNKSGHTQNIITSTRP